MKWGKLAFVFMVAVVSIGATSPIAIRGLIFAGMPPQRYQQDVTVQVQFVADLNRVCGTPPPGKMWGGCVRGGRIHINNPCTRSGDYALYLCHEMAHTNGWSRFHEF